MAKFQSPLLGYNNNVRHKARVFHIQTEDSGVNHPHIITHLFMDGGRILKSVKKSYAEHVGADGMNEIVRGMMKEQHKAMFIALRDGQFDHLVGDGPAPAPAKPSSVAPPAAAAEARGAEQPASETAPKTIREESKSEPAPAPAEPIAAVAVDVPPVKPVVVLPEAEEVPTTTRQPPREMEQVAAASPALTLDFEALEHASQDPSAGLFSSNDLPPPPKNLFAKELGTGSYRAVESGTPPKENTRPGEHRSPPRSVPASGPRTPAATGSRPPASAPRSNEGGRYAPSRPAAIFGSSANRPQQPQSSIFGSDELLSDKSLDEVILSYLAEDLEPPRRK